jgi:hypothetical protein
MKMTRAASYLFFDILVDISIECKEGGWRSMIRVWIVRSIVMLVAAALRRRSRRTLASLDFQAASCKPASGWLFFLAGKTV